MFKTSLKVLALLMPSLAFAQDNSTASANATAPAMANAGNDTIAAAES